MLSYWRGRDEPLWERSLGEVLRDTAHRYATSPALVSCHQGERLSWEELYTAARRVAAGLRRLGMQAGDRAGIWSTSCVEWLLLQLGCGLAGVVLVNVNPAYRSHELSYVLRRSRMKALFLWRRDARAEYASILEQACRGQQLELEHVIEFSSEGWQELRQTEICELPAVQPGDVANIQYTSGTTGSPKGVLLTHRNLVNNGKLIAQVLRYTERDRICVSVPMYHCFGCVIGTMAALASGAAMILPNWTFDARATMQAIEAEAATSVYGVPSMFIAQLALPEFAHFDVSSLRTGVMAGAPCPMEIMKRVMNEMHCAELTIAYGQTESSPVVTMSEVDDELMTRIATVGKALPCTEIKIASRENGQPAPVGEQGEVCVRGYMVMKGYDGDPEGTASAIDPEGWLHTGDLGAMREDGYVQLTGRAKDMIIRGGENIYPREIEEFFYTHPKVAEVHVVGIPDRRLGEVVVAWVRVRDGQSATAEELQEFCRGKIAHFKIPQHIRLVSEFPTTVTGKIQKFRMREIELQEPGLGVPARPAGAGGGS